MPQPTLDLAYWLGLITSLVLPVLVGLVTTKVTSAAVKAVLLLALSTANGFVVEVANRPAGFHLGTAVILSLVAFGTGVLSHFGFWKPTGITAAAQALGARRAVRPVQRA